MQATSSVVWWKSSKIDAIASADVVKPMFNVSTSYHFNLKLNCLYIQLFLYSIMSPSRSVADHLLLVMVQFLYAQFLYHCKMYHDAFRRYY
jgi:hypothetical protein